MKTYRVGDPIVLEVEVRDVVSGVSNVSALFVGVTLNKSFALQGHGGGANHSTVTVGWTVTAEAPPDEYYLKSLTARDMAGNFIEVSKPEVRLRIEGPEDNEPPEILNVTLT
jgi:hypothetical protein